MEQKKKTVYYLDGTSQVAPAVQTEYPILKMCDPSKPKEEMFAPAFKELIYWYWFEN